MIDGTLKRYDGERVYDMRHTDRAHSDHPAHDVARLAYWEIPEVERRQIVTKVYAAVDATSRSVMIERGEIKAVVVVPQKATARPLAEKLVQMYRAAEKAAARQEGV